ncbi:hypothetical protein EEB14_46215 [Rhodococcus sp. WS4]|nr:hypothetical protein EEB14_46215 [Rhodococcus sp. WS4]
MHWTRSDTLTKVQLVMLPTAAASLAQSATVADSQVLTIGAFLIAGLGAHAWYRAAEPNRTHTAT